MKLRALLASLAVAAGSTGCAWKLEHEPEAFDLEESWPRVAAGGPVAVRAGPAPAGWRSFEFPAYVFKLDLQEYTRSLVRQVEDVLSSQNASIESQAHKWLELEVVYASILRGEDGFHCVIDFTVRTGGGYVFGHQARERSWPMGGACNAALARAAHVSLGDSAVRAYLADP